MKYLILSLFALVLIACSQSSNNPTVQNCFKISLGDKWVYKVTDKTGQYQETHIVTGKISKTIDSVSYSVYEVNVTPTGLRFHYTWYMFTKNDTLLVQPTVTLDPIFDDIPCNCNNSPWLKFKFCSGESFNSSSRTIEDFMFLYNDSIIKGKFSHDIDVNFMKPVVANYTLGSKEIKADQYKYDFTYKEQIIEPTNATFDSTYSRIRNQYSYSGEIWFSNDIGFIKIVNPVSTRQLIDYEKH